MMRFVAAAVTGVTLALNVGNICSAGPLIACDFDETTKSFSLKAPQGLDVAAPKALSNVEELDSTDSDQVLASAVMKKVKKISGTLEVFDGYERSGLPKSLHRHSKYVWSNEAGTVIFVRHDQQALASDDSSIVWSEYHLDDPRLGSKKAFATFVEILFTEKPPLNVLLFDKSRDIWVALDNGHSYWSRERHLVLEYAEENFAAQSLKNRLAAGHFI